MSVDTATKPTAPTEGDRNETYAFLFSDDDGKTFRQMATGMPWGAVAAHIEGIQRGTDRRHLALVSTSDGVKLVAAGGPKDGHVWLWKIED